MVGAPTMTFMYLTLSAAAVSDRLGFLNYIAGSLATTLSQQLNKARLPLKELRDNEVALAQRNNIRTGLEQQISRVENSRERGYEKRLAELKEQLAKAESDDEPAQKQHDILLRKALRESEQVKFQALREVIKIAGASWLLSHCLFSLVRRKACAHRTGRRVCPRCFATHSPVVKPALQGCAGDGLHPRISAACTG